jgi:pimeloyl-ACP methyl ester carboxylesterase
MDLVRTDHLIEGRDGLRLFVRSVARRSPPAGQTPVVLVHGARAGGLASFDLDAPGGSLAAELANAGHLVFVMDARGYGSSDRPPAMAEPAHLHPPQVRTPEVARDIDAVVAWASQRAGAERVALQGWATGAHWAGCYTAQRTGLVSHLVLYNGLYGGFDDHPSLGHGSDLEDPERPGQFNARAVGAWRDADAASLVRAWEASIPVADRDTWRDPLVAEAYAATAIARDPDGPARNPPALRVPTGALEDSFYQATGRQLWDASLIDARTLVLRSANDFWSRPEDVELVVAHLSHAPLVSTVVIPDATHFVHLDRPERGRDRFVSEVRAFLRGGA